MVSERALPLEKLIELVNNSPTLIPIIYMVNKSGEFWGFWGVHHWDGADGNHNIFRIHFDIVAFSYYLHSAGLIVAAIYD